MSTDKKAQFLEDWTPNGLDDIFEAELDEVIEEAVAKALEKMEGAGV